jgi:uncharacterized ubiquitin-like protein YukD
MDSEDLIPIRTRSGAKDSFVSQHHLSKDIGVSARVVMRRILASMSEDSKISILSAEHALELFLRNAILVENPKTSDYEISDAVLSYMKDYTLQMGKAGITVVIDSLIKENEDEKIAAEVGIMSKETGEKIIKFISVELVAIGLKPSEGFEQAVIDLFKGLNVSMKKPSGLTLEDTDYYKKQIDWLLESTTQDAVKPSADTIMEKFSNHMNGLNLTQDILSALPTEKRTAINKLLDSLHADNESVKNTVKNIGSRIFHIISATELGKDSEVATSATISLMLSHAYEAKDKELVEEIKEFAKKPEMIEKSTLKYSPDIAALTDTAVRNFPMPFR